MGTGTTGSTTRKGTRVKLMRTAAMITIGKKVYDEARKPQNQARIKSAVAKVQERRQRPR